MEKLSFREFQRLVKTDMKRYKKQFVYSVIMIPGFKYSFHHRLCYYLAQYKVLFPFFLIEYLYFRHLTFRFGIECQRNSLLPEGFCVALFGGIVFYPKSCGKNVLLRPGVIVGTAAGYGQDDGPIIGDNVKFGVHSCVLGGVRIGDNVIIAANAVVVKDVPSNCVVAGVPAKVVKTINNRY